MPIGVNTKAEKCKGEFTMKAKRISKRIVATVLSMMLVISCFIVPSVIADAAGETTVRFHYLRSDGDYSKCDVYTWGDGDAKAFTFTDAGDSRGAVADVVLSQSIQELGFIIRQEAGNWNTKDPDGDRKVDLSSVSSGVVDVYCVSGSELNDYEVSYENAVLGLKLKEAYATSRTEVSFTFTKAPEAGDVITAEDFTITSASGTAVAIGSMDYTEGTTGTLTLAANVSLDYTKDYTITFRDATISLTLPDYFSSEEFESQYTYNGNDLGVTFADGSTNFRVWAPTAEKIELNIYAEGNGGAAEQVTEMTPAENGTWTLTANGNLSGKYYTYTAYFDGKTNKDIVDPYARTVGVNGQRGMILDLDSTDPDGWSADSRHTYEKVTDMEIYEVHVRDFSIDSPFDYDNGIENKGKYLAFTERGTKTNVGVKTGVDHLVDLGVTSVHILPSYDYGSVDETKLDTAQYNWGYDPVNYNSPEGSYSTDPYHGEVRVNEYKQMVKGLHDAGIGVIMDVVYNHTYNTNYCFNQLVPGYFYRPGQNTSGCGNDVASERSMVRKFIADSVKYWADEYHLDGFRFDLMGILDVDTMNAVRAAVDEVDPTIAIYGEGWDMGCKSVKAGTKFANYKNAADMPGIAFFSDTIRDMIKGSVFDAEEKGYVNGESKHYKAIVNTVKYTNKWCPSPSQIINYADCHDNLTLWDKIRSSNPDDSEEDQIRQNLLAAAIVQTAQGIPFMMSGEEFLRTKTREDGTYEHNSYASPDSVNALDYSRINQYREAYNYYKGLIRFRNAHPALRYGTPEEVEANFASALDNAETGVAAFTVTYGDEKIMVVYNPLSEATQVTLPEGNWDVYVKDTTAGDRDVIETVSGTTSVPRISAMVLVQNYTPEEIENTTLTDEATGISVSGPIEKGSYLEVTPHNYDDQGIVEAYSVVLRNWKDDAYTLDGATFNVSIPSANKGLRILHLDAMGGITEVPSTYENGAYNFTAEVVEMVYLLADETFNVTPIDPKPSDDGKKDDEKKDDEKKDDQPTDVKPVDGGNTPTDGGNNTPSGDTSVPATGDTAVAVMFIIIASAAAYIAVVAYRRKKSAK